MSNPISLQTQKEIDNCLDIKQLIQDKNVKLYKLDEKVQELNAKLKDMEEELKDTVLDKTVYRAIVREYI